MTDAFGRYGDGGRQPAGFRKRPRLEFEMPSVRGISEYYGHQGVVAPYTVGDDQILSSSYESFSPETSTPRVSSMTQRLVGSHVIDDPRDTAIGGPHLTMTRESWSVGIRGRPEIPLPPNAANSTLFVQGFPANCTQREASHIFRPFIGYKDTRVVIKEPRHPGGDLHVLCFVEFESPIHAAIALDALQGYKFDDIDPDSVLLRIHFARNPGPRHRGEPHGYH